MKKDISSRKDIELLVNTFYDKVKTDPVLGPYFASRGVIDWDKHLPIMYDFWENVLFHTGGFTGNPMAVHQQLHEKNRMVVEHFQRWVKLMCETTDEFFTGENAEMVKLRASNISTIMQLKIFN